MRRIGTLLLGLALFAAGLSASGCDTDDTGAPPTPPATPAPPPPAPQTPAKALHATPTGSNHVLQ